MFTLLSFINVLCAFFRHYVMDRAPLTPWISYSETMSRLCCECDTGPSFFWCHQSNKTLDDNKFLDHLIKDVSMLSGNMTKGFYNYTIIVFVAMVTYWSTIFSSVHDWLKQCNNHQLDQSEQVLVSRQRTLPRHLYQLWSTPYAVSFHRVGVDCDGIPRLRCHIKQYYLL